MNAPTLITSGRLCFNEMIVYALLAPENLE